MTRFYNYRQNNSGGSFELNDSVSYNVIIEANSGAEADERAEEIGMYFNGCEKDMDCPCCGDRWYSAQDEEGDTTPLLFRKPAEEHFECWAKLGDVYCYVYYLNGEVQALRKKEEME
jgi:hypothetical protein